MACVGENGTGVDILAIRDDDDDDDGTGHGGGKCNGKGNGKTKGNGENGTYQRAGLPCARRLRLDHDGGGGDAGAGPMIPLCASWHPRDRHLAVAGMGNSVQIVETSDLPYLRGAHLRTRSGSAVNSVDFSPDGEVVAVATGDGTVSFFSLTDGDVDGPT